MTSAVDISIHILLTSCQHPLTFLVLKGNPSFPLTFVSGVVFYSTAAMFLSNTRNGLELIPGLHLPARSAQPESGTSDLPQFIAWPLCTPRDCLHLMDELGLQHFFLA